MLLSRPVYRGRFAPTPSGPLHLGSLLTALASWLQARKAGGQWLLRIDDLDTPRCVPGSAEQILRQLDTHGLHWDESPRYQRQHVAEYQHALTQLQAAGQLYNCCCTRAELARDSLAGPDGPIYAGTCRQAAYTGTRASLRLRVHPGQCCVEDVWQGRQCRDLETEVGDFVLRRADGVIGYQLACVVDEAAQGITEVVRGMDLLGSSLRQVHLQQRLGRSSPTYRHLPVLVDAQGAKLSKQNHAPALAAARCTQNLWDSLHYLQQNPPAELSRAAVPELLAWALANWNPSRLVGQPPSICVNLLEE